MDHDDGVYRQTDIIQSIKYSKPQQHVFNTKGICLVNNE